MGAQKLANADLVAAAQAWLDVRLEGKTVNATDVYPAVQRLLTESGLQKSLKAFDKETAPEEGVEPKANKKTKALADLELTEAAGAWLDAQDTNGQAQPAEEAPKQKKRKAEAEEPAEEAKEEAPKKKQKGVEAEAVEAEPEQAEEPTEQPTEEAESKEKKKKEKPEKVKGQHFTRIDCAKWIATIQDNRLKDNTHAAKDKFGDSAGDVWGDRASEDLLKVKGKGFRKEMAKKKRASWRGGGEIDQGVNSIAFPDSDED